MGRRREMFLDIETDRKCRPIVVGLYSRWNGVEHVVGREITKARLERRIPRGCILFTFNGDCFDLNRLHYHLGLDLWNRCESRDLRWLCRDSGLAGGQKRIEKRVGFQRSEEPLHYRHLWSLWERHTRFRDKNALRRILRYNTADLRGMVAIKKYLQQLG